MIEILAVVHIISVTEECEDWSNGSKKNMLKRVDSEREIKIFMGSRVFG
jgi:hypothetical protein